MVTELAVGGAAFLLLMYIFRAPSNLCQDKAKKKMISRSQVLHKHM